MMKLHFRKGAIVEFFTTCESVKRICGKVIEVNKTNVVILEQKCIPRAISDFDKKTVDVLPKIHVNREIIAMWCYAKYPDSFELGKPVPASEVEKTAVNCYDEDGYCIGEGDFFEYN